MRLTFCVACGSTEIVALRAEGRPLTAIVSELRRAGA